MTKRQRAFLGCCDTFSFYITVIVRLLNRLILQPVFLCFSFLCLQVTSWGFTGEPVCGPSTESPFHGAVVALAPFPVKRLCSEDCRASFFVQSLWPPHSWQEIKTGLLCWRIFLCCYCLSPIALFVLDKSSIDYGLRKGKRDTVSIGTWSCHTDS